MPKGLSLHIGLNKYDRKAYKERGKLLTRLPNCDNDAMAKQGLAEDFGFTSTLLLNEKAKAATMLGIIELVASDLTPGDIFFLSFSGHGSRIEDRNNDEDDGYDETWCLYDRMVSDDELFEKWKRFQPGVRVLVIADSCHSGTCIKNVIDIEDGVGGHFPVEKADEVQATCLLLSACQDKQSTYGIPNGKFSLYTHWLLEVIKQYDFCESYRELHNRVSNRMPAKCKPNLFKFGPGADQFVKKRPFKI